MLDTSILPRRSHFEIKIQHSEFVYPQDPSRLLHENAQVVQLHAAENQDVLRGAVVEERLNSTINTREHGIKPQFHLDLRKLTATFAPDIARQMEARIAEAQKKLAGEVALQEKMMEQKLHARQPQAVVLPTVPKAAPAVMPAAPKSATLLMPAVPALRAAASAPAKVLAGEMKQSKQREQQASLSAGQQLATALSNAQAALGKMPVFQTAKPLLPMPSNALATSTPMMPSIPKIDTAALQRQMSEELVGAKLRVPSQLDVNAQLARAKNRATAAVGNAQPAMDIILTQLRTNANVFVPVTSSTASTSVKNDVDSVIVWDEWHARFAKLAHDPILKAVKSAGNASGANTVEVTVWPNHHISVLLRQSGSPVFDQAIVQAYKSLDGNPGLAFPVGTARSRMNFLIDNKHVGAGGVPSRVMSQTSIGDKEVLHFQR